MACERRCAFSHHRLADLQDLANAGQLHSDRRLIGGDVDTRPAGHLIALPLRANGHIGIAEARIGVAVAKEPDDDLALSVPRLRGKRSRPKSDDIVAAGDDRLVEVDVGAGRIGVVTLVDIDLDRGSAAREARVPDWL